MSALPQPALLSRAEARSLTDEVKGDAEKLWRKLVELYDGEAWKALDYGSWRDYWVAEFGEQSLNLSYKQIAAGRVAQTFGPLYQGTKPNERQARELAPLLKQPQVIREVWSEVVESNPTPTAADVRAAVSRRKPARSTKPSPPAHYLPDLVSKDATDNLRTQLVVWFEQGRHIETLLKSKSPLTSKSVADLRSLKHDADLMVRVANHVKKELS